MKLVLYAILLLFFYSCSDSNERIILKTLEEWEHKEIHYPSQWPLQNYCEDTLPEYKISSYDYILLNYADSTGCTSCKLGLTQWAELIPVMDSLNVFCLFVLNPKKIDMTNIKGYLRHKHFSYPVYIDEKDSFNILNHFPTDERFHTFLLDQNSRVLAVGNPIYNPKVKELYLKIIRGEKIGHGDDGKRVMTEASIDKTSVSLGCFDWQEEQKATFTLKNTGDKPLAIQDVVTSCGCTTVTYSKEPVQPGKEIALEVAYKAEHPEHFDKTITVYCNAATSPLTLKISGDATAFGAGKSNKSTK